MTQPELSHVQVTTYVAWEEFYAQATRIRQNTRSRGNGPWGHKHQRAFERIAKLCDKAKLDVRLYIETAFEVLAAQDKRFIAPKDLASPKLVEYVASLLSADSDYVSLTEYWCGSVRELNAMLRAMPDMYPDAKTALMIPATGFDAWFRVLYLQPIDQDLLDVYGMLAYDELRYSRALRDFLRRQVPENMVEFERRIAGFGDG